ncbi:MAG: DUF1848 domain-containing protein [Alphaproteobacteria bacterium]|nr:DUF1848 domain-containing protein [Alphaproteobacteria bacterium]
MIVSASYRTDIPAFYGRWFMNRLSAGSCRVVNPYGGPVSEVDLRPGAVDGFVFWTRNAGPFMAALDEIELRGFPFLVQYTVTGYPRALDASTIAAEAAIAQMTTLAGRFGPRAVVWRYDPIMVSSATPPDWHIENFAGLARALQGATDEVVMSFAQIYRKTRRNLDAAASRHGFTWLDPHEGEKRTLLAQLAAIAADHGMTATLCTQPYLLGSGLTPARCVDAARISDVAGHAIAAPEKGNRPGCLCSQSRDIGAYDTCPHGCAYCYAVRSPALARRKFKRHDEYAIILGGQELNT